MSDQGWGTTSYGGSLSDVLLEVEVTVVTNEQCKTDMADYYAYDYYYDYDYDMDDLITDGMICAGGVEGKDGCQVSSDDNHINKSKSVDLSILTWPRAFVNKARKSPVSWS